MQNTENKLEFLDVAHPLLEMAREAPLFLGLRGDGDAPRLVFAVEVSAWQPPGQVQAHELQVFLDQSRQKLSQSNGAFTELRTVVAVLAPVEAETAATARAMLSWHASHRFCAACGSASDLSQGAGSGCARPARPYIFRAPIRW